jgi:hypothetical protein
MEAHQVSGRWGGRLTSRPLPDGDESIDRLDKGSRALLVEVWLARAANERRVSDSFAVILDALAAVQAEPALIELARRAIDDELRHAEICRAVASRFAGAELAAPSRLPLTYPAHATASPELRHTLHIIGQSCLNETLASAILEASLVTARGPLVCAALRELLSDEVDHARLGWAHLASVRPELKNKLGPWLQPLARGNLKMWRETQRTYATGPALVEQGALTRERTEQTLLNAFRDLVVPGFAKLGLPVEAITRWLDEGAPTE